MPVSAEHNLGFKELLEEITAASGSCNPSVTKRIKSASSIANCACARISLSK